MPYETIQNPTRSNSWIKKSTFLPPPIRVLVRFSIKQVFQMLWIFDLPFKHFVFIFALFGFETHVFAPYLFFFKIFWSLFWYMNWSRTKYGIDNVHTIPIDRCIFLYALIIGASMCLLSLFIQKIVEVHRNNAKKQRFNFPVSILRILEYLESECPSSSELVH